MSRPNSSSPVTVPERVAGGPVPHLVHAGWDEAYAWLVQGTTLRPHDGAGLWHARLVSDGAGDATGWQPLLELTGCVRAVRGRQVHGAQVACHDEGDPGSSVLDGTDGHASATPGVLLAVSVADCVPVFLVDPDRRTVALLHAGWRGIAAGILEAGLTALDGLGARRAALRLHMGPAICGDCYAVGSEVPAALGLAGSPGRVDLRAVLARRAAHSGVPAGRITVSSLCTRCDSDTLFSHRAGDSGRQVAFLGIRATAAP